MYQSCLMSKKIIGASSALEKLKRQLEEAEAAIKAPKKPPAENGSRVGGGGLVIDEWKQRREKYLARQKVESVDSSSSSS
ncbi:hypothetical protein Leryth_005951 [Lithospermum erythrorhizon]|nr:hypothetical protein Leryth_005951 [Lithospermum erythrorhizon]